MKKTLRILFAVVVLVLCMAVFFTACDDTNPVDEHTHQAGAEWESDADNHWKSCTGEDCNEKLELAGHDFQEASNTATCTEAGTKTFTCSICGKTKTENADALGHNHQAVADSAVAADCTSVGKEADQKCSRCDNVITGAEIPALGHDYHSVADTAVAADCTTAGKEADQKCSRCEDEVTGAEIPALGHNWEKDLENSKPASFTEAGRDVYVCSRCGANDFVSLECLARSIVIENGDDVQAEWLVQKYADAWVSTSAYAANMANYALDGSGALKNHIWLNGNAFRFSTAYDAEGKQYNQLSCDIKGDSRASLIVRLINSENGVYASYEIPSLADGWNHYSLSMAEDGWTIALSGGNYTFAQVIAAKGEELGISSVSDIVKMFDTFAFIYKKAVGSGPEVNIYFDNIKIENVETPTSGISTYATHGDKINIDWEDEAGTGVAVATGWSVEQYKTDGWTAVTGKMNSRKLGEDKIVNFVADNGMTSNFTYDEGKSLGMANYLSVSYGNWYGTPAKIYIKISVVDVDGNKTYLVGDQNNFGEIPATAQQLYTMGFVFNKTIEVRKIVVTLKGTTNSQYLYTDDFVLAYHTFDKQVATGDYLATAANCTNAATYYYSCECGMAGKQVFMSGSALGHSWESTWSSDSENGTHYHACERCDARDGEAAHTGGTATCELLAECEVCVHPYGDLAQHTPSNDWSTDADYHWHTCSVCHNHEADKGAHEFDWHIDTPATTSDTGVKHEECTICGVTRNEGTVIPITGCAHSAAYKTNQVDATCTTAGKEEYWHCTECNQYFSDEALQDIIGDIATWGVINATGHNYQDVPATGTAATCTSEGTNPDQKCSLCGDEISGTAIPATGHSYTEEVAENDYLASAATCTAAATYYKSCHCGATSLSTENESTFASGAPLGHMWDTTYTVDNTATESANGSKSIHCTVCSETKDTVQIMATGNTAVLENADGVCSTWDVKKYDGGWVTTGATAIRVKGSHDGSDMLKAHVWRNGSSFRFITNYEATTQFNQISFDIKGDGVSTVKIQFFGPNGIYVTLSLGVAANTWNTQTISLADSNWKLTFAGNDYPLAAAISSMGGSLGVNSAEDLIKTCSQFAIIFNGQNTSGSEGDIYLDNIKFESVATPATAVAPIAITNNLTIDWEGLTTGSGLNSTDWTVQKYNNGWETVATSSNMNVRSRYGSTVVNMVSDSTTRNFAYTLASPLSDVNHFSMDVGNDFQSNTGIKIKVALILSDSSKVYLVGDANNFQTIAYTATQSTITLTNDSFSLGGKSIAKLQVTTQGTNGGTTQYLYTDNIVLSYVAD